MFWIALAAQVTAPVPVEAHGPDVRTLFYSDDFPAYLQKAGVSRIVRTITTVGPTGRVEKCEAEEGSGDPTLDAYTCALISKRARFLPARWTDGTPTYGIIRVPVTWAVGTPPPPKSYEGDLNLTLNQMPPGVRSPHVERLLFSVEESGKILSCAAAPLPGMDKSDPELARIACEQLTNNYKPVLPVDSGGHRVPSVQNAFVHFDH